MMVILKKLSASTVIKTNRANKSSIALILPGVLYSENDFESSDEDQLPIVGKECGLLDKIASGSPPKIVKLN